MSKRTILISFPIILVIAVYFLGSHPDRPQWSTDMPSVPSDARDLEQYVAAQEAQHKVKPDNEARIIWFDTTRQKTPYSVVYLHGFSASPKEGDPVYRMFAQEFGCNLYLARLADHGIDTTEAMLGFTTDRWWESAKEALAIGKAIGDRVIIMSTSTGGTMALALASEFPNDVHALINMSPNVAINNPAAFLLNDPWGLEIARLVRNGKYQEWDADEERKKYWYNRYRLEAVVELQEMLESKMTKETFGKITQPCLTLYYYRNEDEQDPEVKVSAILEMMEQISTPEELKKSVAMPDAGAHVLGSSIVSKDVEGVYREMKKFALEILHMEPAPASSEF